LASSGKTITTALTHDMPSTEHLFPQIHQLRHTMFTIPDKFVKLARDQCDRFSAIENQSSG
jgi:hypothetical protein